MYLLKYLVYVLKHKWIVFVVACKFGEYWHGITHDLSKLLPDEFFLYARHFGGLPGKVYDLGDSVQYGYGRAVKLHYSRNPHHIYYWPKRFCLDCYLDKDKLFKSMRHMVIDLIAMSIAKNPKLSYAECVADARAYYINSLARPYAREHFNPIQLDAKILEYFTEAEHGEG